MWTGERVGQKPDFFGRHKWMAPLRVQSSVQGIRLSVEAYSGPFMWCGLG